MGDRDQGVNQDPHRALAHTDGLGAHPHPGKVRRTHKVPGAEPRPLPAAARAVVVKALGWGLALLSLQRTGPGAPSFRFLYPRLAAASCTRLLAQAGPPCSGLASQAQEVGDSCSDLSSDPHREARSPLHGAEEVKVPEDAELCTSHHTSFSACPQPCLHGSSVLLALPLWLDLPPRLSHISRKLALHLTLSTHLSGSSATSNACSRTPSPANS